MTYPDLLAAYLRADRDHHASRYASEAADLYLIKREAEKALLAAHPAQDGTKELRLWGNYVLELRTEYGAAARRNRGSYSGEKTHELSSEYVVDVLNPTEERGGTIGQNFLRTGKPQPFSTRPFCNCTQGQHAGRPRAGLTVKDVDCANCLKFIARRDAL